jgi:hypothetical protein
LHSRLHIGGHGRFHHEAASRGARRRDEAGRIVARLAIEAALTGATSDKSSLIANDNRPWVLLRPNGISLGRLQNIRGLDELAAYTRAGVGLTRPFTFGRRV